MVDELHAESVTLAEGGRYDFESRRMDVRVFRLADVGTTLTLGLDPDYPYGLAEPGATVHGGRGDDRIYGTEESETLYGGIGNDRLYGGEGGDFLDGGSGDDLMTGGFFSDTFVVDSTRDRIVDEFSDDDDTVIASISFTLAEGLANLTLTQAGTGTGNSEGNRLYGSSGDDRLFGGEGYDNLYGGKGRDVLDGGTNEQPYGSSGDHMDGGAGDDTIYQSDSRDTVVGGSGYDVVICSADYNSEEVSGAEEMRLVGTSSSAYGGFEDEKIIGNAALANRLKGMAGNDVLIGGTKIDTLAGGSGDDVLTGGAGGDTFGFDTFSTTDQDRVTDYSSASGDVLNFVELRDEAGAAGVQSIAYLGTGAFTGQAGQARTELHDGYGLFMFDLDGNRVSDLTIRLDGITSASSISYVI
jgi:Ca2+-binding RTX toxin-like protein